MKVKIGDKWFTSDMELIIIALEESDKSNIANMAPDAVVYATFPDTDKYSNIDELKEIVKKAKDEIS